ncbi:MAG: gamma-glutamylcyclotransferase [Allosphingosinicella sp.]
MSTPHDDFLPEERLAVYGSLRPGGRNAHVLAPLIGTWSEGVVHGTLRPIRSGYAAGYSGLALSDAAGPVPVALLCSHDLPAFWPRLDAFEGAEFVRTIARVRIGDAVVAASLYEWRPEGADP